MTNETGPSLPKLDMWPNADKTFIPFPSPCLHFTCRVQVMGLIYGAVPLTLTAATCGFQLEKEAVAPKQPQPVNYFHLKTHSCKHSMIKGHLKNRFKVANFTNEG